MTTKHPKTPAKPAAVAAGPSRGGLKAWQMDVIACAVIYVAVLVLFRGIALEGKRFSAGDDTVASRAMNLYAHTEAQEREYPLWTPYIFGGFPSMAAGAYGMHQDMGPPYSLAAKYLSPHYWADWIARAVLFFGGPGDTQLNSDRWYVALFLYCGILTYALLRLAGFRALIGLLGGLAMAWNPYLVSLATAGHGGKLATFVYLPLVIVLAYRLFERRRILDMALLAVAFGWQIALGGHTQVLFYSFLTVGLMYLTWMVLYLRENKSAVAFKPGAMLAAALVLAFAVGSVWYVPLAKYVGYSIRGMGPALATGDAPAGYSIADATMWSFPPAEILTFIVPSWFGLKSPYYWGAMPFTSSSFYFGVVPLLFAVLAFFGRKDRLFWSLVVVSVFSLLLSFGQHFQSFYALFFNYLPFFNKFRTPSLIVLLIVMSGAVWAAYGLKFVTELREDERWKKFFLGAAIAAAALLLLFFVTGDALQGMFGSFVKAGEEGRYAPQQLQQLQGMRFEMLKKDLLISLLWLGLACGACYLLITRRLKPAAFLVVVLAITAFDLWRFSNQFFEPAREGQTFEAIERPNRVVQALKGEDPATYRVVPVGRIVQDNRWAAWEVPSLGGYHGAKMRSYQDLLDNVYYNGPNRQVPLNVPFYSAMNGKYIVAEGMLPPELGLDLVAQDPQEKLYLFRNPRALERVYYVNTADVVPDRAEALRRLMQPGFQWESAAVVDRALPGAVARDTLQTASIAKYTPHMVKIEASTPVPALLVLSDAYYAPGWTAYDNGKETEIYQVNGYVRGVYVTPGQHTIEYRYTGKYETAGVTLATGAHFVVWGLVIGAFVYHRNRKRRATE